jgi:hypothetical protein
MHFLLKLVIVTTFSINCVDVLAQSVPSGMDCDNLPGTERYLTAGHTVMIGEWHGTKEMPKTFVRVVCSALRKGEAVSVGLEIEDHTGALETYTASAGTSAERKRLLSTPHWTGDFDGRSSLAYFDMIEAFRVLRSRGFPLTVFGLYDRRGENESPDQILATRLRRERVARPRVLILTLTGNFHNMRRCPGGCPDQIPTPMGALVSDLDPISINLIFESGQAWSCLSRTDCDARDVPSPGGSGAVNVATPAAKTGFYDLQINIGRTSGSVPAISAHP